MQKKDKQKFPAIKVLIVILSGVVIFLIGVFVGRVDIESLTTVGDSRDYVLTGDFYEKSDQVNVNLLWEAWGALEDNYIDKDLNGEDLLNGAVRGLTESLNDPYTFFLSPEENQEYLDGNSSTYQGIGTTLRFNGEYTAIESPIDGFPAREAGLEPGDLILEVDGEDVRNQSAVLVASKIRGDAGTVVTLKIFKVKIQEEQTVEITRQQIDLDNITFEDLGDGIVKIKMIKFTEETLAAFNTQWDSVIQDVLSSNPKGIIIDLRNNPGGFVDAALYTSSEFLERGDVVLIEEDRNGKRETHKVSRAGLLRSVPIVIIVNEGSASASEIFAGALQDHDRATVIGMKTVGKGVEQRRVELQDGSSMHIVFRRWLTPNGKNFTAESPIEPDIEIDYSNDDFKNGVDPQQDKAIEILQQ
ncbi:MAG TPA: S41 family peptidase [candidate division CPR3 bacterium]|uniref:S41 family peptidase n=1 Tax=candidate division CPR3 bacterium TaxID=2268181 RepID=A0A7C1SQ17_UNCC3|nr:S41 family peptidase [candidate division CPR3 bacterium]